MRINHIFEAANNFKHALQQNIKLYDAYIKQCQCYIILGDFKNAIIAINNLKSKEEYKSVVEQTYITIKKLQKEEICAEELFKAEKYVEVIEIADRCIKHCKKFSLLKAKCCVYLRRHRDVQDILKTHAKFDFNIESAIITALNFLYQNKYTQGLEILKKVKNVSPEADQLFLKYSGILKLLDQASLQFATNNYNSAKKLYTQIINLNVDNKKLKMLMLLNIANIQFLQKEFENCTESCCQILEINDRHLTALGVRGKCNMELKEYELAIEDYKAVLSIKNSPKARQNLKDAEKRFALVKDNYYAILGIPVFTTSLSIIKKSYHSQAKKYHPDRASAQSKYELYKMTLKFAQINNAYQALLLKHS